MIFELSQDVQAAVSAMPRAHPKHRTIELLEEAIRRDIQFIDQHPTTLFQCMWNTCWPTVENGSGEPNEMGTPNPRTSRQVPDIAHLFSLWRQRKEECTPGFAWLRSHLPPRIPLCCGFAGWLRGHRGRVACVAASPHGRHIITGGDDAAVCLWDEQSRSLLDQNRTHQACVRSVAFDPLEPSRFATCSYDGSILVWTAKTDQLVVEGILKRTGKNHQMTPRFVESASGQQLCSAEPLYAGAPRWRVELGELVHTGHIETAFEQLCWSSCGRFLAVTRRNRDIKIWQVRRSDGSSCNIGPLPSRPSPADYISGRMTAESDTITEAMARLLTTENLSGIESAAQLAEALKENRRSSLCSVDLMSESGCSNGIGIELGTLGLSRNDRAVDCYRLTAGAECFGISDKASGRFFALRLRDGNVQVENVTLPNMVSLQFSTTGIALCLRIGTTLDALELGSLKVVWTKSFPHPICGVFPLLHQIANLAHTQRPSESLFDRVIMLLEGGIVMIMNLASGRILSSGRIAASGVRSVIASSTSDTLFVLTDSGELAEWELQGNPDCVVELTGHRSTISALSISADGRLLASAGVDGGAGIFELSTGQPLTIAWPDPGKLMAWDQHQRAWITGLAWLDVCARIPYPDGTWHTAHLLFSTYNNGWALVWAITDQAVVLSSYLEARSPFCCLACAGGIAAAGCQDGSVWRWNDGRWVQACSPGANATAIRCIAIDPNSKRIAFGNDSGLIFVADDSTVFCLCDLSGVRSANPGLPDADFMATMCEPDDSVIDLLWEASNAVLCQLSSGSSFVIGLDIRQPLPLGQDLSSLSATCDYHGHPLAMTRGGAYSTLTASVGDLRNVALAWWPQHFYQPEGRLIQVSPTQLVWAGCHGCDLSIFGFEGGIDQMLFDNDEEQVFDYRTVQEEVASGFHNGQTPSVPLVSPDTSSRNVDTAPPLTDASSMRIKNVEGAGHTNSRPSDHIPPEPTVDSSECVQHVPNLFIYQLWIPVASSSFIAGIFLFSLMAVSGCARLQSVNVAVFGALYTVVSCTRTRGFWRNFDDPTRKAMIDRFSSWRLTQARPWRLAFLPFLSMPINFVVSSGVYLIISPVLGMGDFTSIGGVLRFLATAFLLTLVLGKCCGSKFFSKIKKAMAG